MNKTYTKKLTCQNCNDTFYAHGVSKYCVICKPLTMQRNHNKRVRRIAEQKRGALARDDAYIYVIPDPYVKRPRAKAIY